MYEKKDTEFKEYISKILNNLDLILCNTEESIQIHSFNCFINDSKKIIDDQLKNIPLVNTGYALCKIADAISHETMQLMSLESGLEL
jgi:hypothetical protein